MAYKRTNWVEDETPLSADNMNNIEEGITEAKSEITTKIAEVQEDILDLGDLCNSLDFHKMNYKDSAEEATSLSFFEKGFKRVNGNIQIRGKKDNVSDITGNYEVYATKDGVMLAIAKDNNGNPTLWIKTANADNEFANEWYKVAVESYVDNEINQLSNLKVKKYSVSFSGSSPIGTRLDSAVGMTANVAVNAAIVQNDFDNVSFFNRPICCCTWDKNKRKWRVNAYKGEPDFKSDGSNGEVMYECTPFYYKADFSSSGSPVYVSVTGTPCEGYTLAPMFKNAVDKVYCPSYWLSEVSGTATSRSGTYPLYGSLNELMTKAKTFDEKAYLETMENVFSDYLLMLVEFATKDLQTVMMGCTNLRYNQEDIIQSVTPEGFAIETSIASNYVRGQTISIGTTKNAEDKAKQVKIIKIEKSGDTSYITLDKKIENLAVGDYISSRCYINGATDIVEASSGSPVSNTDGKHPCIWRGKVDPWGNGFSLISNMLIKKEGDNYIPYYLEDPYKYNNGNITEDYIKSNITALSTNGYVKSFKSDSRYTFLITPSELGATYNTYASANFYAPRYAVNTVRVGGGFISRREASPIHFGCSNNPAERILFYLGRLNIFD